MTKEEFKEFESKVFDEIDMRHSLEIMSVFESMGANNLEDIKRISVDMFGREI
jgi:hypothetical protein